MTTYTSEHNVIEDWNGTEVALSYHNVVEDVKKQSNPYLNDGSNYRPAVINTHEVSIKF